MDLWSYGVGNCVLTLGNLSIIWCLNGVKICDKYMTWCKFFRKQAFLEVGNGLFCDKKHIKIVKHVNRVEFIVGLKTYNQSNFYLRS